ncbi:hypothetical protein EZV73_07495 [Acidaminobacter sp. JC074]|uniref:hypothetical protein n=1 Tax=Acidaminobacter sp. JC074 TaxID=2530199 RepID=UPI001F101412|nr:hypothetical protein [Acidaminobacter sp. JC074]MCH4887409.1 hypothetical protein [Acidaminobacter sp. JC074]
MIESVNNGKSKVDYTEEGYRVEIPSKKNIFIIVFMCFWLAGWFMGETMVLMTMLSGEFVPFLLIWLIGWTFAGGFAIYIVLWLLFGKEVIVSNGQTLRISKEILGLGRSKEYDIRSIKNFKVHVESTSIYRRRGMEAYGLLGGVLHFDYGMKTIRMGISIDEAEGRYLRDNVFRDLSSYTD